MADNLDITEGAGTTIKTDDIGGIHYQQVKLVDGTLDGTGIIAADIGVKANALRVVPANDITDTTYIGDIKFGESLPAGTNAIGKLAANSGVDIGDVTLTAGTAAIGKLAANSGVDIGDVDVLSIAAGDNNIGNVDIVSLPASTNTIEVVGDAAENAAVAGNPVLVGGRYDATPRTLGDGDVGAIALDADGAVQIADGGNTITIDGTITANLSATDNAVLDTIDAVLDTINGKVTACNTGAVVLTTGTAAIGKLAANTGIDIGDVDVTSIVPGAGATNLGKAEDAAHASGDVGVAAMSVRQNAAASLSGADGDYQPLITDTNGRLHVLDANTANILTALQIMDDWDAVHDSAVSTDGPQLMGAYDSTKPTAVADGDAVRLLADAYGRLLTGLEPEWFNATYDSADATGEGETVKAATGSKKIYIMSYIISSDVETWIKLQDEDSNALTGKFWLKAGGGVAITLPPTAPLVLNVVNKALEVIAEAAGDVSVTITGYLAP